MSTSPTLTTRVVLVRHGESNATVQRRLAGVKCCTGLSDLGVQQAERLRDRYALGNEAPIDAFWSSPVLRARQTAEIMAKAIGMQPVLDPEFEEHRPGDAEGLTFDDVIARFGEPPRAGSMHTRYVQGWETSAEFHYRISGAMHRLVEQHVGRTVLLACHGGVIDVAFRSFLQLPARGEFDLWTLNTSLTEFTADHGPDEPPRRWRLARYNDHAHLAGLPAETRVD